MKRVRLVILEAFACGTPVLASRLGSMQELVDNDETGLHFAPGSAADLARIVEWAWTHPAEMTVMGHKARRKYETTYQPEANYESLMQIYTKAINEATN